MSNTLKKTFVGAFIAIVAFLGMSSTASALTQTELLSQALSAGWSFDQFMQAYNMSFGSNSGTNTGTNSGTECGVTTYGYNASATLRPGMSGIAVSTMQTALNNYGSASILMDGAYGPATKAAVMSFQSMKGLPADGIAGPVTQGALQNSSAMIAAGNCDTNNDNDDTNTDNNSDLEGGVGDITYSADSEFSGEEVGESQKDVSVMTFDLDADEGSDVQVTSVKVEFVQATAGDSKDLTDYASEVTVWFDGEQVGSADADDFNESSDVWTKSISLDGVVIKAGDEESLTVAVTALNNLDSGDINSDAWTVDVLQVRFTDGDGISTTDNTDADNLEKTFNFASFGVANDAELKLSLEDEDINDARVLDVDDTNDTKHEILSFTLEADGGSDILVDKIPFLIATTGEADEAVLLVSAELYANGNSLGTKTVPTDGVVTFDDLDITIDAGDELEFILEVKVQDTTGVADDADTITAQVTVAGIDAEDEAGDNVTAGGTAVGGVHTIFTAGIMVDFVTSTATPLVSGVTGVDDQGMFTIVFDVTAFDSDVFVDGSPITDEAGGATYQNIVADNIVATAVIDCAACTDGVNATFKVAEGETERFVITISGPAAADVFAKAALESVLYALTAVDGDVVYNFDMGEFQTDNVFLNDNAA